jgi:hypothetical protein
MGQPKPASRRITVPVLIRLTAMLRQQPRFLIHVAYEDAGGFVVAEVWEAQEQHDTWFEANVKPNIPVEITQEVVDVHYVAAPWDTRATVLT